MTHTRTCKAKTSLQGYCDPQILSNYVIKYYGIMNFFSKVGLKYLRNN